MRKKEAGKMENMRGNPFSTLDSGREGKGLTGQDKTGLHD